MLQMKWWQRLPFVTLKKILTPLDIKDWFHEFWKDKDLIRPNVRKGTKTKIA